MTLFCPVPNSKKAIEIRNPSEENGIASVSCRRPLFVSVYPSKQKEHRDSSSSLLFYATCNKMSRYYCSALQCRGGASIPCEKCGYVKYCSNACRSRDWDHFHKTLCPHYQRIGAGDANDYDDPRGVLMIVEMLYARASWYRAFETDDNVCTFAKGCFQTGSVIRHVETGRLLTMDILLQEMSAEDRRLILLSVACWRIARMHPDEKKIRITLSKTPLICHRCRSRHNDTFGLVPDPNFGGFLYLCIACSRDNEVTVDLHQVPWREESTMNRENFPVWLQEALPASDLSLDP